MMFFFFFLIIDIALIDAASWRTTTVPTSKKAAATKLTRKSIPRTTSGSRSIGKTKVGPPVNDEMKEINKTFKVLFAVGVALIPVLRRIDDEREILIIGTLCFISASFFSAVSIYFIVLKKYFERSTPPQIMSKAIDVISKIYKVAFCGLFAIGVSKFLDSLFIVRDFETITNTAMILIAYFLVILLSKAPQWVQDCSENLGLLGLAIS